MPLQPLELASGEGLSKHLRSCIAAGSFRGRSADFLWMLTLGRAHAVMLRAGTACRPLMPWAADLLDVSMSACIGD